MDSPTKAAAPARERKGAWGETIRFFLIVFVAAFILRTFIVAAFSIPSGSMLPRMMIGDYLFVAKWPYGYSRFSMPFGVGGFDGRILGSLPERGDIVVFRYPGGDHDVVKRVIGLPGDTVALSGGQLVLNGAPVARHRIADYSMPVSPNSPCRTVGPGEPPLRQSEDGPPRCAYPRYRETLPGGRSFEVLDQVADGAGDDRPPLRVPAGHVLVLGDNRDDSLDGRFGRDEGGIAFLPIDHIVGRALITFFSTDGSAEWLKPWTWVSAARWDRIGRTY